jgi:hypothetical protein
MPTVKDRLDKHDREIAAIRKLIQVGMKLLVENEKHIRRLEASQRETDRQLQLFIASLNRGNGSGHKTKRVE